MVITLYFLAFIISCIALIYSGTRVVELLTEIARFLEMREFVVASFLMAFVTSLPEFFIGVTSAFHNESILSLGNVIGSNIIVLTVVVGIGGIIAGGLSFKEKTLQRSTSYAALIAPLPLFLMLDGYLSRWDGLVLLLLFSFYFHQLSLQEKHFTKILDGRKRKKIGKKEKIGFLVNIFKLLLVVVLLLISSEGVVRSASQLSDRLKLPLPLIGIFLVALGTSGPEIAFGLRSISMGHEGMTLGDGMGSVVMNSTLILGSVALICPFAVDDLSPYLIGVGFTALVSSIFFIFAKTDKTISKKEALVLILLYLLFFFAEIFV